MIEVKPKTVLSSLINFVRARLKSRGEMRIFLVMTAEEKESKQEGRKKMNRCEGKRGVRERDIYSKTSSLLLSSLTPVAELFNLVEFLLAT